VYDEQKPTTRFSDIAGYEGAKREVAEVVDFLSHPERYARAGAIGPRGCSWWGHRAPGKHSWHGQWPARAGGPLPGPHRVELRRAVRRRRRVRVRDLFADARKRAPSIVFIDEIDAIGQRRGGSIISNDERSRPSTNSWPRWTASTRPPGWWSWPLTNRPEVLDPALLRPGRFDREVEIPLPNQAERAAILAVHVAGKHLAPDVDFNAVARGTPPRVLGGRSGQSDQ